jgi:Transposase, Mutator family
MTTTLNDVAKKKPAEQSAEQQAAAELVRLAKEQGLSLTGPDGLLKQLTKTVLETSLNEEMTEHLGYEKHDPAGAGTGNIRNGTRGKTVLTEHSGPVEIDVPRDRAGTFEPQIVKKRQRRLNGVDEVVLSLYAKGLTTGEISAHFAEIYGASVSKETISRITDKVIEEMNDWAARPLDEIYAAIFIDAIVVDRCSYTGAADPVGRQLLIGLTGGVRRGVRWGAGRVQQGRQGCRRAVVGPAARPVRAAPRYWECPDRCARGQRRRGLRPGWRGRRSRHAAAPRPRPTGRPSDSPCLEPVVGIVVRVLVVCCGHRQLLLPAVGLIDRFGRFRMASSAERAVVVVGQRGVERGLLLEEVRFGDLLAGVDAPLFGSVGSHCCSSFSARS